MIRGVIVDVDGTLVDTNWAHRDAWVTAFARFDLHPSPAAVAANIGQGGDMLVPALMGAAVEASLGVLLRKAYIEDFLAIAGSQLFPFLPGAQDLLPALTAAGFHTALATSSKTEHLSAILANAGHDLRPLANAVVTGSDVKASKPAPDLLLAAAQRLGLEPRECVMIGDTPYDVLAANAAGMPTIAVLTGGFSEERLRQAGARMILDNVSALANDPRGVMAQVVPALNQNTKA